MAQNYKKTTSKNFGDMSGGVNKSSPAVALRDNEVRDSFNAIFKDRGFIRGPGYLGLKSTAIFAAYIKMLEFYKQYTGTEKLLSMSGGKLYEVGVSDGAITERYDLTGAGEGFGLTFLNKFWATNGTAVVKLENETAYQVGITAPSGASAAALAGGTLAAGAYQVYASYCRKVSGTNRLYSVGESLGEVVLSGGNGSVRVTLANSSDAQVNNKVVWMTDADGSVIYFYHETGDNTTTAIDVTSATNKNTALFYAVQAANNQRPPAITWIHTHDNRLIGGINNVGYYSLKGSVINGAPVYDLEKWPTANNYIWPYSVDGAFSLGEHLYLNSAGGIIKQPYGDFTARYEINKERLHFISMRTVEVYNGVAWGLTNDGVRFFDGVKFSPDLSGRIRPLIDEIYADNAEHFRPVGKIKRRGSLRTEYQLSFYDNSVASNMNNRTLTLNIDSVALFAEEKFTAPWEVWEHGHGYMAVNDANVAYYGQSLNGASTIYKENTTEAYDKYIYGDAGTFLTTNTNKASYVTTRIYLAKMEAIEDWDTVYILVKQTYSANLQVFISDRFNISTNDDFSTTDDGAFVLDVSRLGTGILPSGIAEIIKVKLNDNMNGRTVYMKISQTANDTSFEILDLEIVGFLQKDRFI